MANTSMGFGELRHLRRMTCFSQNRFSDPKVPDQMYTEIVGHVCNAMKRRYSKQRMELKRGAMEATWRKQIDLYEQQAESGIRVANNRSRQGLEIRSLAVTQKRPYVITSNRP
jgi:hypothetical protein